MTNCTCGYPVTSTLKLLLQWLEEDGHPGCAEDLSLSSGRTQVRVAREAAEHCETDPVYHDGHAEALPGELRAWADQQEKALELREGNIMITISKTDLISQLAEGMHTAFRKGTDSFRARQVHQLISAMPDGEWGQIVRWTVAGIALNFTAQPDPAALTGDELHVLLDVAQGWRGSPLLADTPWADYDSNPDDDPKSGEAGWKQLLASAEAKLNVQLGRA